MVLSHLSQHSDIAQLQVRTAGMTDDCGDQPNRQQEGCSEISALGSLKWHTFLCSGSESYAVHSNTLLLLHSFKLSTVNAYLQSIITIR